MGETTTAKLTPPARVTLREFDEIYESVKNWGRWGPDDELGELGKTFNGLLARLEASFAAQRQFVANASHELRTPLARQRTLVEVALRDPDPTIGSLQQTMKRVLATGEEQERLIEALLTLARSQRGPGNSYSAASS